MKYFLISVAMAGICLYLLAGKQSADTRMLADGKPAGVCMANLSAGTTCQPAAQSQQKYVLVRGQLLPL